MQFSLSRVKRLLYRDWIIYKKPALYAIFLIVLSSLFIFWLPLIEDHNNYEIYETGFWAGWYFSYMFIGGILLTSIIFWEFKSAAGRIQYLSLPSSNFEKLISRSIYPMIVYPILLTLILAVVVKAANTILNSEPLGSRFWEVYPFAMGGYISLVTLMLVFGIALNKYVAPKSIIISMISFFIFIAVFFLIFRLTLFEMFDGFKFNDKYSIDWDNDSDLETSKGLIAFVKFVIWIVIPGFFCTVAYFKMKEKQV